MDEKNNSGRVTTREFYEALLDQNKQREQMELRIVGKIDDVITLFHNFEVKTEARLAAGNEKFENIDEEIKSLKKWDKIIGYGDAILAFIAAALGLRNQ